ncbi:hypothetical protein ABPG74_020322 [Tetrahymena malaccensis]
MTKVYEVEKIIGHKKKGNQIVYHIQWKGYSLKSATYEPAKNILDKNMLKKYQQKHLISSDKPQTPLKKQIGKSHQTSKPSSASKRSVKKSVQKVSNAKSTPKSKSDKKELDPVKEIHNYQKDVSKLLVKSDITSILHVFKDDGKSLYTVTIGKHPKQYLVSSHQVAKYASPDLIIRFYEKLIR